MNEVVHHHGFELRAAMVDKAHRDVEDGVLQQPGLHQVRLGDAELLVDGLEAAVVEQGDLHGALGRKL